MAEEAGAFGFDDVVRGHLRQDDPPPPARLRRREPRQDRRASRPSTGSGSRPPSAPRARRPPARSTASPLALPALTRAVKLQNRAARVGFDWPDAGAVLDKIAEETAELVEARDAGDDRARAEEYGDLMFVMANLARHLGIDPEAALRAANAKFTRRFEAIEAALAAEGRTPAELDPRRDGRALGRRQGARALKERCKRPALPYGMRSRPHCPRACNLQAIDIAGIRVEKFTTFLRLPSIGGGAFHDAIRLSQIPFCSAAATAGLPVTGQCRPARPSPSAARIDAGVAPSARRAASDRASSRLASRRPAVVADQPVVMPDRDRQAEQRLQQAVERRRREEVGAAHDVGDALVGVVDHDGQVVGGADVAAGEHDVAEAGRELAGSTAWVPGPTGRSRSRPAARRGPAHGEVEADRVAGPAPAIGRPRQVPG